MLSSPPSSTTPTTGRHDLQSARTPRSAHRARVAVAALACAGFAAAPVTVASAAPAPRTSATAAPADKIWLGAAGDVSGLSKKANVPLASHTYGSFSGGVPNGRMITVYAPGRWAAVATAQPGSKLYNDIVRWARTIKSRPGPILLAYQHEPEVAARTSLGSARDFTNAYRRVVTIFRSQGVTNVSYTWQMTAWAFRAKDRQAAALWYPGDAYVDVVGADAYNWNTCGHGRGKWVELSTLAGPMVAFAKAHGKQAALPEFASYVGSQRTAWLNNAHTWMKQNRNTLAASFYFNRGPTNPANMDCRWALNTASEYTAFGDIARDTSAFQH